jgi:drug/metabolite transporter (DMT)-like permease
MSHLPFTLLAYLLNSISVTVDKFLLTKSIPDPLAYVFFFSCYSLIALFAIPFTHIPSTQAFLLASTSTLLWTTGAYLMFKALQMGHISRVIPLIGTLIPLFLLTEAVFNHTINLDQVWAVVILVLGMVFLTFHDWRGRFTLKELSLEIFSALLFAISYLILRQAYLQQDFLTVFVWSRLILIPIGVVIFLVPTLHQRVFSQNKGPKINFLSKTGALFLGGQAAGGSAELLLTFSVSLATPALVNSLQGSQYAFLFVLSLFLSHKFPQIYKERLTKSIFLYKIIGILLIGLGLYILAFAQTQPQNQALGVTYSPRYAQDLGLDPKKTFAQMFSDLNIKYVRLPLYWDEVEKTPGKYDLFQLDYYLTLAQKQNAKVIPVLGMKVPRWPECFIPKFDQGLSTSERHARVLELLKAEVLELKDYPSIEAWQVENEPLLAYGVCPKPDQNFLHQEVNLVRSLDSTHPILISDSGELSTWTEAMQTGDWFGITMYRTVWDKTFGFFNYPIPSFAYEWKKNLAQLFAPQNKHSMIVELQAEPWAPNYLDLPQLPLAEQLTLFPPERLNQNLEFAQKTNFERVYLWGVEWWYLMQKLDHSEYLETTKTLFNSKPTE